MSDQDAPHPPGLWPVPGDGVLARLGSLILLSSVESPQLVDTLLDVLERVAGGGGDGHALIEQIAAVLAADSDSREAAGGEPGGIPVLAFGGTAHGLAIMVSGGAWAEVTTGHGPARLEASQPGMLLRCVLRATASAVRGGLGPADNGAAKTDRFSRLDGGTVRAGGLSFYAGAPGRPAAPAGAPPAPAPVPTPAPEPAQAFEPALPEAAPQEPGAGPEQPEVPPPMPTEQWQVPSADLGQGPALAEAERQATILPSASPFAEPAAPPDLPFEPAEPFEAVLLTGPGVAADIDVPERPPLSKVTDLPPGTSSYISEAPIISGVYCKNGHFDDPEALFCAVCGISMNQQTLVPRPGTRPPLGVLVLDDGAVFQLDTDYIVGREPSLDDSVAGGRARPLKIADESGIVSRVHAAIRLDGWRVLVTDLGSANGTRVRLPRQDADTPLVPQVPVVLAAGSQIDLGGRGFRYESHRGH